MIDVCAARPVRAEHILSPLEKTLTPVRGSMKKYAGIYKITITPPVGGGYSCSSYTYIGKSNDMLQRYHQHQHLLRAKRHPNHRMQQLYDALGASCFEFQPIELVEDVCTLEQREVYYIQALQPALNIMNTKFSQRDIEEMKHLLSLGKSIEYVAKKYDTTRRYVRDIARGYRWGKVE